MKKIIALLIGCCLGIAGATFAQQPGTEESPAKKGGAEKTTRSAPEKPARETTQPKAGHNATTTEKPTSETGVKHNARTETEHGTKSKTTATGVEPSPGTETTNPEQTGRGKVHGRNAKTNAEPSPSASANAGGTTTTEKGRNRRGTRENAQASPTAAPSASAPASTTTNAAMNPTPGTSATVAAGTNPNATNANANPNAAIHQGNVGRSGKRVEAQQVQQIKQQHASFRAQPRPDRAPSVTFNANFRISNSDRWRGPQYEAFRSYHPEWHDQGWYRSHYRRVELIGGGWYYWNNGYWEPAWGYDSNAAYYPYDGPIYVGQNAEPPDKVIADVQTELQDMGYYQGDVDGLLGPLTRQALRDYQADHGLEVTEAIDEPTLDSLQLS
jgi:hypothetical protein